MAAAKRVLRYLCSTSGMGLVLGGRSPVVLTGHADASWADDQATQRSSQGYTFGVGSGSVSWRATRSSSVLGSSCEAEIYAGAMAAQELRWLTYLLTDLGEPPRSPPVLYVDNKAMLALCREQRLEHRTKHIALRYFLARELQQRGQLRLAYVASEANTADVFTKALAPCDHQRCCTQLGLLCSLLCLTGLLTPCSPPLCLWGVKRPSGSPPAFKARYVARGFSLRQGVDYFHTFSPTPKMTTLRVLLHVAAQRDYELHSLDFSTAFLQGNLHEEIWLRRPPGFTGLFPAGTKWSLRRPVYATQRSSQGYSFSLGSGSVSWRSTRSSSVLSSNCEAEIYAWDMAAQELRWLTYLQTDLGEQPRSPPVLYVDNKAMIALCQEHRLEHRENPLGSLQDEFRVG
ncbi:unnamed protein product [Closterium sp. NIES-53]